MFTAWFCVSSRTLESSDLEKANLKEIHCRFSSLSEPFILYLFRVPCLHSRCNSLTFTVLWIRKHPLNKLFLRFSDKWQAELQVKLMNANIYLNQYRHYTTLHDRLYTVFVMTNCVHRIILAILQYCIVVYQALNSCSTLLKFCNRFFS